MLVFNWLHVLLEFFLFKTYFDGEETNKYLRGNQSFLICELLRSTFETVIKASCGSFPVMMTVKTPGYSVSIL